MSTYTTLSDGTTTLNLPGDFEWVDEYTWAPVVQETVYSLTGSLVVEAASKQAGRPITLQGRDDMAWVSRSDLETLRAWAATPGKVMTLTIPGRSARQVVFRHQDTAIDARMVIHMAPPMGDDNYVVTLRFMEI